MAIDNTHTKYLRGADKKVWENYKEAYKASKSLDNLFDSFGKLPELKEGEEYEIPVRKPQKDNKNNNKTNSETSFYIDNVSMARSAQ